MHRPYHQRNEASDDGPIFVDTLSGGGDGKLVNLGNTEMQDFRTNDSAMEEMNSPSVAAEFGLGSPSTSTHHMPHTPTTPTAPFRSRKIGDLNTKTGEFWGLVGLSFAAGILGKTLFDKYYK